MAEYKLSYTASEVNEKLKKVDDNTQELLRLSEEINTKIKATNESIENAVTQLKKTNIEKVILFYGEPISICGLNNIKGAIDVYKNYDIIIFGDKYQDPSHSSYDDTSLIIQKLHENYFNIRIVGYVPIGMHPNYTSDSCLDMVELKSRVDQWIDIGANGIFLDEFGYDYYVTRERQNEIINYCHEKGLFVFANSWSLEYCFNNEPMTISWLENFEANPNGLASVLNENDYYLFENLFFETSDTNKIECGDVWRFDNLYKYYTDARINGKSFSEYYGTKLCCLNGIHSKLSTEEKNKLKTISVIASAILNIDAVAFGDEYWGATGYFDQWELPDFDIMTNNSNAIVIETKTGIKDDGIEEEFPYKWSTSINGKTYAFVWNIPNTDHETWVDGMRYATIDDTVVENAWLSIFNFQSEIAEAENKIQSSIDSIDSEIVKIDEGLIKIDKKFSEVDEGLDKIDSALVSVEDVTLGFSFREVQW